MHGTTATPLDPPVLPPQSGSNPGTGTGPGPRLGYFPALDGLRALAVAAVLLYHANLPGIPGGFLGVEMFFVISGYLITSLLLAEWETTGRVDLGAFWLRRARRLLPAVCLLLVGVVGVTALFLPTELAGLRGDVVSTAAYVNNWYQVFAHKSYFESVGRPSLLRHMWSLAVEEQFYVVWPLVFTLALSRLSRRALLGVVLAGAAASLVLMAILFHPNSDPSRVYYGTDTRAAGLLLGVALALCWTPGQGGRRTDARILDAMGIGSLVTLGACFAVINEFQPLLYRGGFLIAGLATAELIAVAVHPQARLIPRLLGNAPLRWLGTRSYGVYLWHFPVFMLTRPQLDVPWDNPAWLGVRLLLTGVIADASYRWVESPIRHGALGRAWAAWRHPRPGQPAPTATVAGFGWAMGAGAAGTLAVLLGVALWTAKPPPLPEYLRPAASLVGTTNPPAAPALPVLAGSLHPTNLPPPTASVAGHPPVPSRPLADPHSPTNTPTTSLSATTATTTTTATNNGPSLAGTHGATNAVPTRLDIGGVTAIGDSVLEGVTDELRRTFGQALIMDADQGRLPWHTPAIVRQLHANGRIQPIVILHIGNNGFFSPEIFAQIMAELRDARRVVVVNLKVPRRWESLNNSMLETAVKSYPNAVLVDWRAASGNQPRLFWKDGLHVRPEGARVYAELIRQALRSS